MSQKLETVIKLQQALLELREAERQLGGVPDWMEELHAEHSARMAEIAAVETAAEEAAKGRRKAEAATLEADTKLKHYQQQVSLVRTQREYAALLQEIDTVKSQIKVLEEQALAGMEGYEQAQRELEEHRSAFSDLDQRYQEALAKWDSEKPAVEQQAETLRAEVKGLREALPRNLLALFDRLVAHRQGDALAAVRRTESGSSGEAIWHCTGCNYLVRLQVVADIKGHGALVQCEGCKRILYVEDEAS